MNLIIVWTDEKRKAVCDKIEEWMKKYGAYSGEKIGQDDDCQIYAPVLLEDIVDDIIKPDHNWDDEEN